MNTGAAPDQAPAIPLSPVAVHEAWVPSQRDHQRSAILKIDAEFLSRYLHIHRPNALELTC